MPHYSEMVERVARTLAERAIRVARLHDTPTEKVEAMLPAAIEWAWPNYTTEAHLAIETMRNPTPAMEAALSRSAWHSGSGRQPRQVISDVVDAALKDEHPGLAPPREG